MGLGKSRLAASISRCELHKYKNFVLEWRTGAAEQDGSSRSAVGVCTWSGRDAPDRTLALAHAAGRAHDAGGADLPDAATGCGRRSARDSGDPADGSARGTAARQPQSRGAFGHSKAGREIPPLSTPASIEAQLSQLLERPLPQGREIVRNDRDDGGVMTYEQLEDGSSVNRTYSARGDLRAEDFHDRRRRDREELL